MEHVLDPILEEAIGDTVKSTKNNTKLIHYYRIFEKVKIKALRY